MYWLLGESPSRARALRTVLRRSIAAGSLALTQGCVGGAPDGVVEKCDDNLALPPSVSTDILFVIDNSSSMQEEQEKVVAELAGFISTLDEAPVAHDFQIGVVTTGVSIHGAECAGTNPQLIQFPNESGRLQLGKDLNGNVLSTSERKILRHDDPDLMQQFRLLIGQGVIGSGQEMGLEAMRRALSEPLRSTALDASPPGNEGFLRAGSRLLVIVVTDEDDCSDPVGDAVVLTPVCGDACTTDADCGGEGHYCISDTPGAPRRCNENTCETPTGRSKLEPVSDYVDFLTSLDDGTGTGRKRDVFLAVIGPVNANGEPDRCQTATDEAQGSAARYVEATNALGDRALVESICADNYGSILVSIAELVTAPQVLQLAGDPHDPRLLQVRIERPGSEPILCRDGDGFEFEAATGSAPAQVTLDGKCRLQNGDKIDVRFVCAT